jgi:hypothetical protein
MSLHPSASETGHNSPQSPGIFAPLKPVKGFPVRTVASTCFGYMFDGGKEVNTF